MARLPTSLGVLGYFAAWLAPWRSIHRVRARRSGLLFFVHRADCIGRHIAKYGEHEPAVTRFIASHLRAAPPGIVVDVGANFGWHALHAARIAGVETVIAFEPDAFNAWLLERNAAANGLDNVVVAKQAVGANSGVARLFLYKRSNLGRHSLIADTGNGSRLVPLVDLDHALDQLGFGACPISLIKVDVEGFEPAVIAGARRTLADAAAIVLEFSVERSTAGGLSTGQMVSTLDRLGFAPHTVDAVGEARPIDVAGLDSVDLGVVDLVWLRRSNGAVAIK